MKMASAKTKQAAPKAASKAPKAAAPKAAPKAKAAAPVSEAQAAPPPVSPVDLAGVAPGLKQDAPKQKIVNMKCQDPSCDSMQAVVVMDSGPSRLYHCKKCNRPRGVAVGGVINV